MPLQASCHPEYTLCISSLGDGGCTVQWPDGNTRDLLGLFVPMFSYRLRLSSLQHVSTIQQGVTLASTYYPEPTEVFFVWIPSPCILHTLDVSLQNTSCVHVPQNGACQTPVRAIFPPKSTNTLVCEGKTEDVCSSHSWSSSFRVLVP